MDCELVLDWFEGFSGGRTQDAAVVEEHGEAPAEDHAEGEDVEEGSGLGDGEEVVKVAAGEDSDGGEGDDDEEEGAVALDHDGIADADELRGEDERVSEEERADEECDECPEGIDAADGRDEHAEAGGHAEGGDDDFAQSDGGAALADAPDEDDDCAEDGGQDCKDREIGDVWHGRPLSTSIKRVGRDFESVRGRCTWNRILLKQLRCWNGRRGVSIRFCGACRMSGRWRMKARIRGAPLMWWVT